MRGDQVLQLPRLIPVKDNIPSERTAVVTLALIAVNLAVYFWAVGGALLPLFANLLFLWIFGGTLENAVGRLPFLVVYVLGGLLTVGLLAAAGATPLAIVAATGACAAVIGGYLVQCPRGRVLTFVVVPFSFTIVAVPAIVFLGLWAALQVAFALLDLNGQVAGDELVTCLAPIAGLGFGAAMAALLRTWRRPGYPLAGEQSA